MAASSHQRRSGSVSCSRAWRKAGSASAAWRDKFFTAASRREKSLSPSCAIHFWICYPGDSLAFQTKPPTGTGSVCNCASSAMTSTRCFPAESSSRRNCLVRVSLAPRRVVHAPTETGRRECSRPVAAPRPSSLFSSSFAVVCGSGSRAGTSTYSSRPWTLVRKKALPNLSVRTLGELASVGERLRLVRRKTRDVQAVAAAE